MDEESQDVGQQNGDEPNSNPDGCMVDGSTLNVFRAVLVKIIILNGFGSVEYFCNEISCIKVCIKIFRYLHAWNQPRAHCHKTLLTFHKGLKNCFICRLLF